MSWLTKLFQHFIAFVQHEVFHVLSIQDFVSCEGIQPPWRGDYDMGTPILVSKNFCVFGNRRASIKSADANVRHVLGEPRVLVFDLESKFTCMAKDDYRDLPIHRLQLLECCKNKHSSFPMTGFGLTKYVHAKNCLRNTFLLDWTIISRYVVSIVARLPSEGCSKPRSLMARKSSGFSRKSLSEG